MKLNADVISPVTLARQGVKLGTGTPLADQLQPRCVVETDHGPSARRDCKAK